MERQVLRKLKKFSITFCTEIVKYSLPLKQQRLCTTVTRDLEKESYLSCGFLEFGCVADENWYSFLIHVAVSNNFHMGGAQTF